MDEKSTILSATLSVRINCHSDKIPIWCDRCQYDLAIRPCLDSNLSTSGISSVKESAARFVVSIHTASAISTAEAVRISWKGETSSDSSTKGAILAYAPGSCFFKACSTSCILLLCLRYHTGVSPSDSIYLRGNPMATCSAPRCLYLILSSSPIGISVKLTAPRSDGLRYPSSKIFDKRSTVVQWNTSGTHVGGRSA